MTTSCELFSKTFVSGAARKIRQRVITFGNPYISPGEGNAAAEGAAGGCLTNRESPLFPLNTLIIISARGKDGCLVSRCASSGRDWKSRRVSYFAAPPEAADSSRLPPPVTVFLTVSRRLGGGYCSRGAELMTPTPPAGYRQLLKYRLNTRPEEVWRMSM